MADYSTRGQGRGHSRPTTPTGSVRTFRANGAMRPIDTHPNQHETFFDDATPVDNRRSAGSDDSALRDSHDLSFADGTRDSVVDNMLLSLDQLPAQFAESGPPTSDFFLADDNHYPPPKPTRQRGHTYASSQSSDYDFHADDSSRYAAHHTRGRRSNSSNNIPSAASRRGSLRGAWPGTKPTNAGVGEFQQTNPGAGDVQQTGHMRGGGKASKGSGSSSMDFGHGSVVSSQRLGLQHRSSSFDRGAMASRTSPVKTESILARSRPLIPNYHQEYDAAPEPTIPAGPRRVQAPQPSPVAYPPQPVYAPPQAPVPRRKTSIRSTTSYRTLRKNKSQPEPNMRMQAQEFVNASNYRDLPPIPAFQDPPAPSPTVATRKPSVTTPALIPVPREKPGFFRRVFGGGLPKSQPQPQLSGSSAQSANSNTSHMAPSPAPSHTRPADIDSAYSYARPRTTANGADHIASQIKSTPPRAPHTASSMQNLSQQAPPALVKKHSSFFRRRKKSVSEAQKPPDFPVEFQTPRKPEVPPPQPSPGVSSLRKVMNPYFNDLGRHGDSHQDPREAPRPAGGNVKEVHTAAERPTTGFSPNYKPHKDATVRAIKPSSRGTENTPPSSRGEQVKAALFASNNSPKMKLRMKHGRTNAASAQEDTFLADSSSCNEDRSGQVTPSGERSALGGADETRRESSLLQSGTDGLSDRRTSGGEQRADMLSPQISVDKKTPAVSPSQSASEVEDDGWIITSPSKDQAPAKKTRGRSKRVWLEPTSSEEKLAGDDVGDLALPLDGARSSQKPFGKESPTSAMPTSPDSINDIFHSATSLPTVQVDGGDTDNMPSVVEPSVQHDEPTDMDRDRALRIFGGEESSALKAQAATMLGDVTSASTRTREAFMDLFEWTGVNVLVAMRDLCSKLVLKAETQQVDRILMSLSERWCACNPNHGFKATDVVHTICYSILLLNTDLHVADIESRMTRTQFVKNTLPTVARVCKDAVQDAADETLRPKSTQFKRGSLPWTEKSEPTSPAAEDTTVTADVVDEPLENRRARSRLSVRPPFRTNSEGMFESASSDPNVLVNAPYTGSLTGWENLVEIVLKDFYESIRKQRLPLHGAPVLPVHEQPSSNSLSVSGMLRRTPSVLSKAPSDHASYRGRSMGKSWKNRSRPRLYPTSTVASSRTSLDDQSVWSPAGSSTWSKYSHGKTQTSMSMESLGSHFAHGDYQQAIGFANALSQAIIREEGMTIASDEEFTRVAPLLEDETLELVGAPWAKEGILKHKHHLEALDKKAKDRTWNECFAVIEKGYLRLFSFSMNSKSQRHKNKSRPTTGGVVGGGNWMDNAEALDSFLLRQTIASALPPPGYSKSRPHVFALSLPTGAVHLFQVGTPDIAREFVSTANYWSARLSKEPLVGGVSNIEYGWGENVINTALIRPEGNPSAHGHMPRPSMASSLRSSMDHATGTIKARLPGDKAGLSDWSPPMQSMTASNLMEVDQLRALSNYVKNVEEDFARHNELRAPMLIAFSPRHPNAAKAMANWERKSSYLLREIVKFRTYMDSLAAAQALKEKIYAEREATEEKTSELEGGAVQTSTAKENDGASEALPASTSTVA